MIQARAVAITGSSPPTGSDGHGEAAVRAAGRRTRCTTRDPRATQRSAAGLPVTGGRAVRRADGATPRRLADRVRHQARRERRSAPREPGSGRPRRPAGRRLVTARASARVAACRRDRNVLFITLDQWRGDCLSALGHPVVETPTLDALAGRGVLFANHWANAAPCGPSRACLYTGTYQHRNRSILNGTPLDARFTNVALLARDARLRPRPLRVHRHLGRPAHGAAGRSAAVQLRRRPAGLPGPDRGPLGAGQPGLGTLAGRPGRRRARRTRTSSTSRSTGFPGADDHGSTWAPARFPAELSQTTFVRRAVVDWLEHTRRRALLRPRLVHPAPPAAAEPARLSRPLRGRGGRAVRRVPDARGGGGHPPARRAGHGHSRGRARPTTSGSAASSGPPTTAPSARWTTGWPRSSTTSTGSGLAESTLVVLTSDHGEMGGDHWLLEKLGYWDESYHVPLIVVDPRPKRTAAAARWSRR